MLRSSLTLAGVVVLGAAAAAQTNISSKLKPIPGPVRDGGVYHLATNAWTRHASTVNVGADIIYKNNCNQVYYSPLNTDTYVDEGRIPSPTSPTNLNSRPGCTTSYTVDGFQLGYCTDQTSIPTYTVNFYQSYAACATVIGVTPLAGFGIAGLPASPSGLGNCWLVTLDLDAPPQTASLAFSMLADGDGTYTGTSGANLFGWSMATTASAAATGPLIAGDLSVCSGFAGTRWETPINYAGFGTGMGTLDQFRIEGGGTTPGCYFFGGNPMASFWLEVFADACAPPAISDPGTPFCAGDATGGHTACPCGNNSAAGANEGCLSSISLTLGGKLRATSTGGIASISADTGGSNPVTLFGTQMANSSCLYFQGTAAQNGGNGSPFGDGLRCAATAVKRLGTKTNVAGASQYPVAGDLPISVKGAVTVGLRTYQAWYRNAAAFCTASTFNLSNGESITWVP